jgi:hypothetical protein
MKNFLILAFVALLAGALLSGNSNGAGVSQGADRTGSPLSEGSCNIIGCHTGNAFSPTIEVQLLEDGMPTQTYEPGKDYLFRVRINAMQGSPAAYGFQAVALGGSNNVNAGDFSNPPSGVRITTIQNRQYPEHNAPSESNVFEIPWTAPMEMGEVRFYAAGNAVNGNNDVSGDGVTVLNAPLRVNPRSAGLFAAETLPAQLHLFPNPAGERLSVRVQSEESGLFFMQVADMRGRVVKQFPVSLFAKAEHLEQVPLAELGAGHYVLRLSDGRRVAASSFIKQ